jgi:hypothetical protein
MTLAHHFKTAMKTSNRIATLLIVLALGIFIFPRVQAVTYCGDLNHLQEDPKKKQNFTGFIIDAYPAEYLLFSDKKTYEIHDRFTSTAYENNTDTGQSLIVNSFTVSHSKSKLGNSMPVHKNKDCIGNLLKPKK